MSYRSDRDSVRGIGWVIDCDDGTIMITGWTFDSAQPMFDESAEGWPRRVIGFQRSFDHRFCGVDVVSLRAMSANRWRRN